jgi:hypothetical protein
MARCWKGFCAIGGSEKIDYVTAPADHGTTASSFISGQSGRMEMVMERSGDCSTGSRSVEEQIERSKSHWSMLVDESGCSDEEEVAEVSNVEEFKALQMHPTWGGFFVTFGYDTEMFMSAGDLVMGKKFAEGAQVELYEVQIKWDTEITRSERRE